MQTVVHGAVDNVEHRARQFARHRLRQGAHAQPVLDGEAATVRLFGAFDQAEQGGFSLAVPSDQRTALAPFELQRNRVQQQRAAVADRNILETNQCHIQRH